MVVFCFFLIGATKERVSKTCHFTALLIQSVSGFLIFKIQWLHVAWRNIPAVVPILSDRPVRVSVYFNSSYLKELP